MSFKPNIYSAMDFPPYKYEEYPRMVYGAPDAKRPDGAHTVANKEELTALQGEWFFDPARTKPVKPAAQTKPTPTPAQATTK